MYSCQRNARLGGVSAPTSCQRTINGLAAYLQGSDSSSVHAANERVSCPLSLDGMGVKKQSVQWRCAHVSRRALVQPEAGASNVRNATSMKLEQSGRTSRR